MSSLLLSDLLRERLNHSCLTSIQQLSVGNNHNKKRQRKSVEQVSVKSVASSSRSCASLSKCSACCQWAVFPHAPMTALKDTMLAGNRCNPKESKMPRASCHSKAFPQTSSATLKVTVWAVCKPHDCERSSREPCQIVQAEMKLFHITALTSRCCSWLALGSFKWPT